MRNILVVLLILVVAAGAYFLNSGFGSGRYQHASQGMLNDFSDAINHKNGVKLSSAFKNDMTTRAKIRLEVNFSSLPDMKNSLPEAEEFDKPTFFIFINNILYSLKDYGIDFHISGFHFDAGQQVALFTLLSKGWGDSELSYGDIHTKARFNTDSTCEVRVVFDDADHPSIDTTSCKVTITSASGLAGK